MSRNTQLTSRASASIARFRLSLQFSQPANCPACGRDLRPALAKIVGRLLVCEECKRLQGRTIALCLKLIHEKTMARHISERHDLLVYTSPLGSNWPLRTLAVMERALPDSVQPCDFPNAEDLLDWVLANLEKVAAAVGWTDADDSTPVD